jgi:hypothetical protein
LRVDAGKQRQSETCSKDDFVHITVCGYGF